MHKGQTFTLDFMISITVFLAVLIIILPLWYNVNLHITDVESRRDMYAISLSVSDALVRSTGYPPDWNVTNVQSIGLAKEEYVLDMHRVLSLMNINYATALSLMRLANYNVYLYATDLNGYNVTTGALRSPVAYFAGVSWTLADKLNNSGAVWDMYQATGPDTSSSHNQRYYYRSAALTPEQMFNNTVLNLSNYRTLVLDEPNVTNSSINLTGVRQFLQNGGVIMVKAHGLPGMNVIDYGFAMHSENKSSFNGIVGPHDLILTNNTNGDTVAFSVNGYRYYSQGDDNALWNIIADQDPPNSYKCLVCMWNYSMGKIYYAEDFEGTVNPGPSQYKLSSSLNLIGTQMQYGLPPVNTSDVISIMRVAVLEGIFREPVAVHMFIWR